MYWHHAQGTPRRAQKPFHRLLLRPVRQLRVSLLRVLESNFPGDSLSNSTDMRIPTPENSICSKHSCEKQPESLEKHECFEQNDGFSNP